MNIKKLSLILISMCFFFNFVKTKPPQDGNRTIPTDSILTMFHCIIIDHRDRHTFDIRFCIHLSTLVGATRPFSSSVHPVYTYIP